jgi:hypothetical protein
MIWRAHKDRASWTLRSLVTTISIITVASAAAAFETKPAGSDTCHSQSCAGRLDGKIWRGKGRLRPRPLRNLGVLATRQIRRSRLHALVRSTEYELATRTIVFFHDGVRAAVPAGALPRCEGRRWISQYFKASENYRAEGYAVCNMGRLLCDDQRIARISAQALC